MKSKKNPCQGRHLQRLSIRFVGDPMRGKRLQAWARCQGWRLAIEPAPPTVPAADGAPRPDLVILDDFPASQRGRAAFYRFRTTPAIRFLVLNDAPHALAFLHLGALSFIRFIPRDPRPEAFARAVCDFFPPARLTPYERSPTTVRASEPAPCGTPAPGPLRVQACC